jgi:NADH:ubiquinone oxidoreductase subunit 6 (subunit J)
MKENTDMGLLSYAIGAAALISALAVVIGKDVVHISVALFVYLSCVSAILLSLGFEYLALCLFATGVMGIFLCLVFGGTILGDLKTALTDEYRVSAHERPVLASRAFGLCVGILVAIALGVVITGSDTLRDRARISLERSVAASEATMASKATGDHLLGEQVLLFQLMGLYLLSAIVGSAMLLRRSDGAE